MNKKLIAAVAAVITCAAASAMAADAAPAAAPAAGSSVSVAVLDLQKIMKESAAAKSIREQIEKKREQFQQEVSKDEDRLRKRDKDLAEQRSLMAPEKFEQERNSFKTEVETVQKEVQKKRLQLDRAYSKALAEVQDSITAIVKELSAEKKFSLMLPASQTLYYDGALEVTDVVLDRLNKKLSKVTVKIEAVETPKEAGKETTKDLKAPAKDSKAK